MLQKILFREYVYPGNTISCALNSTSVTGVGTKFTELVPNAKIEVETSLGVTEYLGKISVITDDTHLTLTAANTLGNIAAKNFWIDWTFFKLNSGDISKNVESENKGEAGAITFDNTSINFLFNDTVNIAGSNTLNPVYSAFAQNLDEKEKYILRFQAGTETEYLTYTEKVVDFSTIEHPEVRNDDGEIITVISFDLMDKLSALAILAPNNGRAEGTLKDRILLQQSGAFRLRYQTLVDNATIIYLIVEDDEGNLLNLSSPIINPGEIISLIKSYSPIDYGDYLVVESVIQYYNGSVYANKIVLSENFKNMPLDCILPNQVPRYYSKEYFGVDINLYESGVVTGLDAIKIIEAMVKQQWPDIVLINQMGVETDPFPRNYAPQLIGRYPFDKEPLTALTDLLNSLLCWGYFDRVGRFVLSKKNIYLEGEEKEIPIEHIEDATKKRFWDKIADKVTIEVTGWTYDTEKEGYLKGNGVAEKEEGIKARNEITKSILVDSLLLGEFNITMAADGTLTDPVITSGDQQEILNHYAALVAEKYFAFYGKRHEAYEMSFVGLTMEMIQWELVDIFIYNDKRYFATNISFDIDKDTFSLTLPSVDSYDYNIGNVLIAKSEESYSTGNNAISSDATSKIIMVNERNVVYVE